MSRSVLLPPEERQERPLPGWVVAVALVGLAIVCCSLVPAVLRRSRLARDHAGLHRETRRQERTLRRLECERRAARTDSFAYERAIRELLDPPEEPSVQRAAGR